ncbi:EAL domain-containing protein [Thiotrichales bacterium 19S3-7]|nr:EAL domain-containing protein [Thiotrichales bacterium 19S3-7]MCF6800978.1 EAL domain-containing protein [Thiotrichales bacterium 19S3-11]
MTKNDFKILIIDTNKSDRALIKRTLSKSAKFNYQISELDLLDLHADANSLNSVDCILVNCDMPKVNGLALFNEIKLLFKDKVPAMVIMTGHGDEDLVIESIESGNYDYLNKSAIDLISIEKAILNSIQQNILKGELNKKEQQLKVMALHDTLTHLPNRTAFQENLTKMLSASERYHRKSALLFIDLDDFKNINDGYGHPVGDVVLQEVSARIHQCVRKSDLVARTGGDEFAVILDEIAQDYDAGVVADKICKMLSEPFYIDKKIIKIGASVGIFCFSSSHIDVVECIKRADIAMYRAKKEGRGAYQFYQKKLHDQYLEYIRLDSLIKDSLKYNEISLVYQPIIELVSGKILGFEVLCRWYSKKLKKHIRPDQFISLAESNGFIHELGLWIIQKAYQQILLWRDKLKFSGFLSINLSPVQLSSEQFIQNHQLLLKKHPILSSVTHFEITETSIMSNANKLVESLEYLKDCDIKIHIDDFGTGYSSLSRLKNMPISVLKIDRSFISEIGNEVNNEVVQAIISMADAFRLEVIAEGIETKEQLEFLKQLGCRIGQGYHFYKPLTPEVISKDLIRYFKNNKR